MRRVTKGVLAVLAIVATYIANELLDHFGVANFIKWTIEYVPFVEVIQRQWFRYLMMGIGGLALGFILGRYSHYAEANERDPPP